MGYNYLYFIFICIITFIQSPKPENIQIFEINYFDFGKEYFHEITVFKNQIFGLQFSKGRGLPCHWSHSYTSKESKYISFLNSTIYDYLGEECQKENEIAKNLSNSTHPYFPKCIYGGSEYYYEIFKALDVADQPQLLNFSYFTYNTIQFNVSIKVWICDEKYKDQCINNETTKCVYDKENKKCISKTLCDKVENVSKFSCENAVTSTPSLTKCSYEEPQDSFNANEKCAIQNLCTNSLTEEECASAEPINPKTSKCVFDKIQNVCKEEKKLCNEIENGATKDICLNAKVSDDNKTCVLNYETNLCNEVYIMKNDAVDFKKNILLCCFLSLLFFI